MAEQKTFGAQFEQVEKAFSDIFSFRVLAWQLGGTILAALCFSLAMNIPTGEGNRFGPFILAGIGFIAAYTVLSATGCIVTHILDALSSEKDESCAGVAPLHFLVDNIGTATLLPLIASAAAVVLAVIVYLISLPADGNAWQTILVAVSPIALVVAVLAVCDLFVLLFLTPSMVVSEQPPLMYALRKLWHVGCRRRVEVARTYGAGLVTSMLVALPVWVILSTAAGALQWAHLSAASGLPSSFAQRLGEVYFWTLLCAPVAAVVLAFMNALSLNGYRELVQGLETEEEEEEGAAPSGGEEPDIAVEGEDEEKTEPADE